ncbi:MAG: cytochrome C oxidase subunit IV family protein [Proteobacteria bacterium]|nr:cytochrome C oxidase subunit IV family protein [Pseudomonadota bacterium]
MKSAQATMSRIWLLLVCATLAGWALAENHGAGRWTVLAVMLFALFKARLVFLHFMELKLAPRALRLIFEAWIAGSAGMIVAMQWLGRS